MKTIESFFLGILAALGALVTQAFFLLSAATFIGQGSNPDFDIFSLLNTSTLSSFEIFPFLILPAIVLTEELFKYLVIIKRVEPFHVGKSVVLNSFMVGFGFAVVELFIIYENMNGLALADFPFQKLAEITLVHIFTSGIIGFFVALKNPTSFSTFLKAVSSAFFVHLIYNTMAVFQNDFSNMLIVVFLTILLIINTFNLISVEKEFAS